LRRLWSTSGVATGTVASNGSNADRRQLAAVLIDLAAQEASMGRGAEALQALAESSRLDEQIGRLPRRSYQLAVAALAHVARDERVLAISALGGYDAHPSEFAIAPFGRIGGHVNWLDRAGMAGPRGQPGPDAGGRESAISAAPPTPPAIGFFTRYP